MTNKYCDLHTHSTASDGSDPPETLGKLAKNANLAAIALTDHDTTAGLIAAAKSCLDENIQFVPGIEISADPFAVLPGKRDESIPFGTLHILGLFIKHDDEELFAIHQRMKHARDSRNPAIVAKLQSLGLTIEYGEVTDLADQQGTKIIGRPHIAQLLIQKGYVKTIHDAFHKYIGQGKPAYVRRDRLEPDHAIDAIHHAGGLAVIAHPLQLKAPNEPTLEHFIKCLKNFGLDAIETVHSDHPPNHTAQYNKLAKQFNLLTTGGSDYHGSRKSIELGSQNVPYEFFEKLKAATINR